MKTADELDLNPAKTDLHGASKTPGRPSEDGADNGEDRAMPTRELNFGIPDLTLEWSCGGTVNPSGFAGHQLVVLFLPLGKREAAAELASYEGCAHEFANFDTWFLPIAQETLEGSSHRSPIAVDPADGAWSRFVKLAELDHERTAGGAFLFTHGGTLQRAWPGQGHATAVLGELNTRA